MSISHMILEQLDELVQDEFSRFKSFFKKNMAQGFSSIPRSRLENATQHMLVDEMVERYGPQEAARITAQVLRLMERNELSNNLEKQLAEACPEVNGASSSSSSSSSQTAGVSQNVSTAGESNVHAPVLSGGNYHGPVTISFTTTPKT